MGDAKDDGGTSHDGTRTVSAGERNAAPRRASSASAGFPPLDEEDRTVVTSAPRWSLRAATLAVLTTVPSGIWRCSMALGRPVGVDEAYRREHYGFPGWGTVYAFGLTLVLCGLAFLTLGLAHRWGEVAPRWIPFIGGKRVPPLAAIIPAAAGAIALTLLWASVFSSIAEIFDVYGLTGTARTVAIACYTPLLLWGPLLGALTVSYAGRTLGPGRSAATGNERLPSATTR